MWLPIARPLCPAASDTCWWRHEASAPCRENPASLGAAALLLYGGNKLPTCSCLSLLPSPTSAWMDHPSSSMSLAWGPHLCPEPDICVLGLHAQKSLSGQCLRPPGRCSAGPLCILCISTNTTTAFCGSWGGPCEWIRVSIFLPGCPRLSLWGKGCHFMSLGNKKLRIKFHL